MEFKLIATTGRARGQAVEIRAAKFFVGRHDNCQLRPNIPGLAGIHALMEERENRLYLRDFGAEGGTGLNDRVLHAREMEIFDGDLIQIGPMVLTLSVKGRGEGPKNALFRAPDGWPFLEGEAAPPARPSVVAEPVVSRPRPEPTLVSTPAPAAAKAAPFLSIHTAILKEIAAPATATVSTAAAALAPVVADVATDAIPSREPLRFEPIVTKAHGRRAIACEMIDDVMVISLLSPDLQDEETVSPVRYELRSLLEEEKIHDRVVVDMGHTRYLSSRAVGVLLAHYQGLERVGSTMRVCGVSKEIKPVLDQMRLSMLIDIYPTVQEAIQDSWE